MGFSKENTSSTVIGIIADKLSLPEGSVKATATFKDLGADSLDTVELIMSFEEAFGIEIKDEEAEKIVTVSDAIDHIHEMRTK